MPPPIPIPLSLLQTTRCTSAALYHLLEAQSDYGGIRVPVTPTLLHDCIEVAKAASPSPGPETVEFLDKVHTATITTPRHPPSQDVSPTNILNRQLHLEETVTALTARLESFATTHATTQGFERVEGRLEEQFQGLATVKGGVKVLEERIDSLPPVPTVEDMDGLERRLETLSIALPSLEERLARLDGVTDRLTSLDATVAKASEEMAESKQLSRKCFEDIGLVSEKVTYTSTRVGKLVIISEGLPRLQKRHEGLVNGFNMIKTRVEGMKGVPQTVERLKDRAEKLEEGLEQFQPRLAKITEVREQVKALESRLFQVTDLSEQLNSLETRFRTLAEVTHQMAEHIGGWERVLDLFKPLEKALKRVNAFETVVRKVDILQRALLRLETANLAIALTTAGSYPDLPIPGGFPHRIPDIAGFPAIEYGPGTRPSAFSDSSSSDSDSDSCSNFPCGSGFPHVDRNSAEAAETRAASRYTAIPPVHRARMRHRRSPSEGHLAADNPAAPMFMEEVQGSIPKAPTSSPSIGSSPPSPTMRWWPPPSTSMASPTVGEQPTSSPMGASTFPGMPPTPLEDSSALPQEDQPDIIGAAPPGPPVWGRPGPVTSPPVTVGPLSHESQPTQDTTPAPVLRPATPFPPPSSRIFAPLPAAKRIGNLMGTAVPVTLPSSLSPSGLASVTVSLTAVANAGDKQSEDLMLRLGSPGPPSSAYREGEDGESLTTPTSPVIPVAPSFSPLSPASANLAGPASPVFPVSLIAASIAAPVSPAPIARAAASNVAPTSPATPPTAVVLSPPNGNSQDKPKDQNGKGNKVIGCPQS